MIIGICGKINTGKNTIGKLLESHLDMVPMAFADQIKHAAFRIFEGSITEKELWGSSQERGPKVRKILQLLGTDIGRDYDPDIWVKALLNRIGVFQRQGTDPLDILPICEPNRNIVITDIRFPNEAEAISNLPDGFTIHISRPNNYKNVTPEAAQHPSELAVDNIPKKHIDYWVENNGTLQQLEDTTLNIIQNL